MMLIMSRNGNNEVRRIQFTGRSTYILSLPKKWINEMNLKAGDLVNIVRDANHSLTIVPNSSRLAADSINEATALITQTENENSLKRKVISMYLAGYNIIHLKAKSGRLSPYILRNLVMAAQNERALQEMGLKGTADCLSYRVAVKSIERVADHAVGISSKLLRLNQKITKEVFDKIQKMSQLSLSVLSDSVEAFLRRDYVLADSVVDKAGGMRSLESEVISYLDNKSTIDGESSNVDIKIILEDIRRTAEHASDIAEAAMNQTIREVIEVRPASQREKG